MKRIKIITVLLIVFLISGCGNKDKDNVNLLESIKVTNTSECNNEIVNYYEKDDISLNMICLNEIMLDLKEKNISLKYYIENENKNINDVLEEVTSKISSNYITDDGKAKIYNHEKINIIECAYNNGMKKVYITNPSVKYDDSLCS